MTNTEQLIEALCYAEDEGIKWYEVFDDLGKAKRVLALAAKEEQDEYEMAQIIDILDDGDIFIISPEETFRECFNKLRRELREV